MRAIFFTIAQAAVLFGSASSAALAAQSGEDFVKTAIQGDNTDIMMGRLAEQKGSTVDVRSFGQTLVQDHTSAKQEMMTAGKQAGAQQNDAPTPDAEAIRSKLSALSGLAFDGAFADAMINDHQKEIALFENEANLNDGVASTVARKQLPVLHKHLQMAQDIQKTAAGGALVAQSGTASGFASQEADEWRGSKLVGVNIYGPNNQKVGDINDFLVGRDGRVSYVIVGVGGFLGIGEKNVAIPFNRVSFSQQPMMNAAQAGTTMAPVADGVAPANTGMAPNANGGPGTPTVAPATGIPTAGIAAANQPGNPAPMAAPQPRSMAYPDHGIIDYTADQLKSAPTFTYAK